MASQGEYLIEEKRQTLCELVEKCTIKALGNEYLFKVKYDDWDLNINLIDTDDRSYGSVSVGLGNESGRYRGYMDLGHNDIYIADIDIERSKRGHNWGIMLMCYLICYILMNKPDYEYVFLDVADTGSGKLFKWYESFGFKIHPSDPDKMTARIADLRPGCVKKLC